LYVLTFCLATVEFFLSVVFDLLRT
jgi:hypothetical protein